MSSWKGLRWATRGWGSSGGSSDVALQGHLAHYLQGYVVMECGQKNSNVIPWYFEEPQVWQKLVMTILSMMWRKGGFVLKWLISLMTLKVLFVESILTQMVAELWGSQGEGCGSEFHKADWPQQGALQKEQWGWNSTAVIVNLMLPSSLTLWNRWSSGLAVCRANVNGSILCSPTPLIPSENGE